VTALAKVVADQVTATIAPRMVRQGDQISEQLDVTVENHNPSLHDRIESIDWVYGSQSGKLDTSKAVLPLSRATVSIPISEVAFFGSDRARVTVRMASGQTVQREDAFGFSPVVQATPSLKAGNFHGLEHVPVIDLAVVGSYKAIGPGQLSGKMWMTWDSRNLYIAARVTEASYVTQVNPRWMQAGDSVGIGLQPDTPGANLGRSGADWYSLYVGATKEGPVIFRESLPMDILTAAHARIARSERDHTTAYLIALPWETIPPFSPSHPLFSVVLTLNNNDGRGRPGYFSQGLQGWEEWADGLNNFRLDSYRTVVLVR
jgi:beta-glucosidase